MENDKNFLPYQECFDLYRIGFKDSSLFAMYNQDGILEILDPVEYKNLAAILYQQAFKFFRDKFNLYHDIGLDRTSYPKFCFEIHEFFGNKKDLTSEEWGWIKIGNDETWGLYRDYEQAELACIRKLIKLIKNRKKA